MAFIPYLLNKGFAPDLDVYEPGVFSYCYGMEFVNGLWQVQRNAASSSTLGSLNYAAGSYTIDGLVSRTVTGGEVVHVAYYDTTASKIKVLARSTTVGAALADRSLAGSYTASTGEDNTVTFCQYGNYTLMATLAHTVQIRDSTTTDAFANVSGTSCPKAKICVTWGPPTSQRVMLLNYNDGTAYVDGWWTSHKGGPQSAWTPDLGTDAGNGRLYASGPITCGIAYRDDVIAFGTDSVWLGRYSGPPYIVNWQRVASNVGCVGPHAAKVIGGTLYFLGKQGLFSFDGQSIRRLPWPIDLNIRGWMTQYSDLFGYQWIQLREGERGRKLIIAHRHRDSLDAAVNYVYLVDLESGLVGGHSLVTGSGKTINCFLDQGYSTYADLGSGTGAVTLCANALTPWYDTTPRYPGFIVGIVANSHEHTHLRGVHPEFVSRPPALYFTTNTAHTDRSDAGSDYSGSVASVTASPWRGDCNLHGRYLKLNLQFQTAGNSDTDFRIGQILLDMDKGGRQ